MKKLLKNIKTKVKIRVVKYIPNKVIRSTQKQEQYFDKVSEPVLTYYLDYHYTGSKLPKYLTHKVKTPMYIYRQLATNAGINNVDKKNKYVLDREIGKKLPELFKNRPTPIYYPPFLQ